MPTFEQSQLQVYTLTEAELKPLWRAALQAYTTAQKEIETELAKWYAKYLSTADKQDYYNVMIQFDRLNKLQNNISALYRDASIKAGKSITDASKLAITGAYGRQQYTLSWFSPAVDVGLSFSMIDPRIVEASVFGTAELWKKIPKSLEKKYGNLKQYIPQSGSLTEKLIKNRFDELSRIQQTITAGLIQGKSYTSMISDIKDLTGREIIKDGVRSYTGAKANASRIIRTEATRNMNAGALASMQSAQAQGLEMQKIWIATLDSRTRSSHGSADGQKRPIDGLFNVNGAEGLAPGQLNSAGQNINCRCASGSVIEGLEPSLRRGRNPETGENEVFEWTSYNSWAVKNGFSN